MAPTRKGSQCNYQGCVSGLAYANTSGRCPAHRERAVCAYPGGCEVKLGANNRSGHCTTHHEALPARRAQVNATNAKWHGDARRAAPKDMADVRAADATRAAEYRAERRANARQDSGTDTSGYIYVVGSPFLVDGLLKIGRTITPEERRGRFCNGLPGAEYRLLVSVTDQFAAERALHRTFAARRMPKCEWFTPITVDEIATALAEWILSGS